jgi:hypothetical protein
MSDDLIEHFKLDAQCDNDRTIVTEHVSDTARGMREVRVETIWYKEKDIGHGSFGEVWLEAQRDGGQMTATRAIKKIGKRRMKSFKIDYKRELYALAKLSRVGDVKTILETYHRY